MRAIPVFCDSFVFVLRKVFAPLCLHPNVSRSASQLDAIIQERTPGPIRQGFRTLRARNAASPRHWTTTERRTKYSSRSVTLPTLFGCLETSLCRRKSSFKAQQRSIFQVKINCSPGHSFRCLLCQSLSSSTPTLSVITAP